MNDEHGYDLHAQAADHYGAKTPPRKSMIRSVVTVFFGAVVVIGGLGGAGYWFYNQGQPIQDDGKLPILLPDPSPIKIRPEDPGGMEVPHRDTTVYDQLTDIDPDADVVLQELPDMPRAPEVVAEDADPAAEDTSTGTADIGGVDEQTTTGTASDVPGGESAALPEAAFAPVSDPETQPSVTMQAPEIAEPAVMSDAERALAAIAARAEKAKAAKAAKPAATGSGSDGAELSSGDVRIQLASIRKEDGAAAEWKRLSSKNKDLLGNLQMFVQRTDLGDKGVFYRLQAGPLADTAAAEKLCDDLKQRNVGCLVVRP